MKLTIIESPFAGDLARNKEYLRRAILDCISHNELPFASHGFFVHFLDDTNPRERSLGIGLGYEFYQFATKIAFYIDYGMSSGMQLAYDRLFGPGQVLTQETKDKFRPMVENRKIGLNP